MTTAYDYDTQFVSHLASNDTLKYFLYEGVSDELLASPVAKSIFEFAQSYYNKSDIAPSLSVLQEQFPSFKFCQNGDLDSSPQWIVERLRQRYRELGVQEIIRNAAKLAKTPEEAYAYLRNETFHMEDVTTKKGVYTPEDYDQRLAEYRDQVVSGHFVGATSGFTEIDEFMGGLRFGALTVTLARPERCKTWFLLKAFVEQTRQGMSPFFHTLELTEDVIFRRLCCLVSGFPYSKMERGDVTQAEYKTINKAMKEFNKFPHYYTHAEMSERTVAQLALTADRYKCSSIIIDQLSFIHSRDSYSGQGHLQIREIVQDLKNLASRKGKERSILIAAQLNRTAAAQDQMADIAQAALSDSIGQFADTCFCLHQTRDMRDMDQIEFGIIKGRNHGKRSWMVDLDFIRRTSFEITEELEDD